MFNSPRKKIRGRHPQYRTSWRWWLAEQPAWRLIISGLSIFALYAILLAALQITLTPSRQPIGYRLRIGVLIPRISAMFQAVIGVGIYPSVPRNHADALLAAITGVLALFVPALVIAVVLIRIWSVRAFIWRNQASVCLPWEVDDPVYSKEKSGTEDATIAIRFYKRLRGLSIIDLHCEAYLRFIEITPTDGTPLIKTIPLQVLSPAGERTTSRSWPISREGTTFTLWIPVDAPLDGNAVRTIQGFNINDSELQTLLVRVSGKVAGLGVDVADERWYSLNPESLQVGRFARVAVDLQRDPQNWEGWDRFEEPARQGLFVYGRLMNPNALREFYGHFPRYGIDYVRAAIHGFRRTWSVASDNSDTLRHYIYHDPESGNAPEVQVLFLNLEGSPGSVTEGILLRVDSQMIASLVGPDGNYVVEDVTHLVRAEKELADGPADIIRTYLGRSESVASARRGLRDGTAVIEKDFLEEVFVGMRSYDLMLRSTFEAESLPAVPVVSLTRRLREGVHSREGRPAEQG